MGTEQVSGKPNPYGSAGRVEWEEKEGKKRRRWGGLTRGPERGCSAVGAKERASSSRTEGGDQAP